MQNMHQKTIESFGSEWCKFDQLTLSDCERKKIFCGYFSIFPWERLPHDSEGFDMGCGSGRWATLVAGKVKLLHCIDASDKALKVAKKNLNHFSNVQLHLATTESINLNPASQDFGYSLGVLHHVPDTESALKNCTKLLKPGAPFLLYLYYKFDNRPFWFRGLWRISNILRYIISRMPNSMKNITTDILAILIYFPLSRVARLAGKINLDVSSFPLSFYRNSSLITMRTDSRDRFGTPLEQRFTRQEIALMMQRAGLTNIRFSESEPYWVAIGERSEE